MHKIFSFAELHKNEIDCIRCSWKGGAHDAATEELILTDAIELYCPQCSLYLGFVNSGEDDNHSN